MDAFGYPFRFSGGRVVKVDTETDAFAAQTIAAAIKTGKGELWLNPTYGSDGLEFLQIDIAGVLYTIAAFHPSIRIDNVDESIESDGTVKLRVEFTRL